MGDPEGSHESKLGAVKVTRDTLKDSVRIISRTNGPKRSVISQLRIGRDRDELS